MKKYFFLLCLSLFIAGCNTNHEANKEGNNNGQIVQVKNSSTKNFDRQTGQKIAQHLVSLASSVPNVKDATAIVLGPYAIVGIDVDKDLDRSQVGSIKYTVAESLKHDPNGANAIVVADPDLNARLKEIQEDIQNGRPIQGIINELADITGRIMPEIPADIIDPTPKDKQKEKLSENEKNELEKEQNSQSNHHIQ